MAPRRPTQRRHQETREEQWKREKRKKYESYQTGEVEGVSSYPVTQVAQREKKPWFGEEQRALIWRHLPTFIISGAIGLFLGWTLSLVVIRFSEMSTNWAVGTIIISCNVSVAIAMTIGILSNKHVAYRRTTENILWTFFMVVFSWLIGMMAFAIIPYIFFIIIIMSYNPWVFLAFGLVGGFLGAIGVPTLRARILEVPPSPSKDDPYSKTYRYWRNGGFWMGIVLGFLLFESFFGCVAGAFIFRILGSVISFFTLKYNPPDPQTIPQADPQADHQADHHEQMEILEGMVVYGIFYDPLIILGAWLGTLFASSPLFPENHILQEVALCIGGAVIAATIGLFVADFIYISIYSE